MTLQTFNVIADNKTAITSIDTNYTISKIRTTSIKNQSVMIGSSYKGTIVAYSFRGKLLWENVLSGYMNHDLWTADLDQDGQDEILTANADGHIYCLSNTGQLLWSFKANDAPMYSVSVLQHKQQTYVVAGSYDKHLYYLDAQGNKVKSIHASNYVTTKPWGIKNKSKQPKGTRNPQKEQEIANFIRPLKDKNNQAILAVHGTMNSMQSAGSLYLFKPLADKPFKTVKLTATRSPVGDLRIADFNNDGFEDIIMGSTKMKGQSIAIYDSIKNKQIGLPLPKMNQAFGEFGYRVAQSEIIQQNQQPHLLTLYGNILSLLPITKKLNKNKNKIEVHKGKYSYNDMWKDSKTGHIILASAQSGGSNFHIIDTNNPTWIHDFVHLTPSGKLARMQANMKILQTQISNFNNDLPLTSNNAVYLMSDYKKTSKEVISRINKEYRSPIFLGYGNLRSENWDRASIKNEVYKNKRDKRQKYDQTQSQILKQAENLYQGVPGGAYWGGHGNDPFFRSFDTHKKTLQIAGTKKTVMIFPELAKYDKDFEYVLSDFVFPLAEEFKKTDAKMFLRNKHTFWQSMIYKRGWADLVSGKYADVFVPAMEETTDKSMDLSIAARTGLWASGAVNQWGTRFSRDNTSFDRLRQHSHQMVPNLALRQFVYHIANGATYVNNFAYQNDYLEVLWDLIGKDVLYSPKPNQILSYSPVHLSMLEPDGHYVDEGNNVKWLTLFNQEVEDSNPMVFSHLNGSWPGAPVTQWDYSRYASGVQDRHLNYLPPQPNGMVLITPPQSGINADKSAPRGLLVDNLHPLYKNIMTEFYTNGRDYISADGKQTYPADSYYQEVTKTIQDKSQLLPITVKGNAAWVVAQIAPKTLRLTLIDGGYINPQSAKVEVHFNTITPTKVTDILDNTQYEINQQKIKVDIPTGLFRFIDIQLTKAL
ncbi:MAG: hypothetical protein ACSHXM_09455 [Paraglaciecola sp.]